MNNKSVKFLAALGAALLGVVLTSCRTEHTINIGLSQGNVGVDAGQTVVFRASTEFDDLEAPLKFQWQTNSIDSQGGEGRKADRGDTPGTNELNWVDIPGEQERKLVLRKVDSKDAAVYRCAIYQTGELAFTNFTAYVALHVTRRPLTANLATIVTGPFLPGPVNQAPAEKCCANCVYMRLVPPNNPAWWTPDPGAKQGTLTYISPTNYKPSLDVVQSGANPPPCCTNNNVVVFSVPKPPPAKGYQFIVCFPKDNHPKQGEKITFSITYN
jgi:hypothetical protein